jgi:flagellar protein FlgJ
MTTEERAAWGIPETDKTPYKMTDNGPVPIGGGDTNITNVLDGGGKFEEAFAKGDATTIGTVYDAGLAAQRNLGRIDQLGALLEANPTGAGAAITQFAGSLGIPTEGLDEVQAAQALINSLVPEQRQPGSGPMSDADLALFKQSLPQIINQPGGNKIIIDTMRSIAEYDAEGARIVQRLRNGELDRAQAFEALQNRVNPLSDFKPPSVSTPAPPGTVAPEGIEQDVWDAMTPEERALWD